jgi:hypothetical protein
MRLTPLAVFLVLAVPVALAQPGDERVDLLNVHTLPLGDGKMVCRRIRVM